VWIPGLRLSSTIAERRRIHDVQLHIGEQHYFHSPASSQTRRLRFLPKFAHGDACPRQGRRVPIFVDNRRLKGDFDAQVLL
jgi:hypothetical protein